MSFEGQVVIVTGAASGVGAAIARGFAEHGATVELLDRDGPAAAARSAELPGGHTRAREIDVRDHAAVSAVVEAIRTERGRLDVLVNCAGVREVAAALELTPQEWRHVIDVNLGGTFNCAQAAGRVMVAAGHGSIVNISSTSGLSADPSRVAYCASKAGIIGLTRALALDLGGYGVRVNAVCPGLTRTPLTESYFEDRDFVAGLPEVVPLGRAANAAEIADVVIFLAGDGARYVSGVAMPVDGGFLAGKSWSATGGAAFLAPVTSASAPTGRDVRGPAVS